MKGDDEPVDNRVAITGREYEAVVEDEAEQRRRLLPRGQETRLCSLQEYYLLTRMCIASRYTWQLDIYLTDQCKKLLRLYYTPLKHP